MGRDCEPVHERGEEVKGSAGGIAQLVTLRIWAAARGRREGERMKITEDWWTVIVGFALIVLAVVGLNVPWKIFSY